MTQYIFDIDIKYFMQEHYSELEKYQEMVETTIDLEAADHHHFMIKADFNSELKRVFSHFFLKKIRV